MASECTASRDKILVDIVGLKTYLRSAGEQVKAVDDVSFSLRQGETYCLVGESGSGKSVLALSIIQLLPQRICSHPAGVVWLNGVSKRINLLTADESMMRQIRGSKIAMIFQEPMTSLNPVFTVGEQIIEALRLHNPDMTMDDARKRSLLALQQVHIKNPEARLGEYPHRLSGGQRQRVMIAMAIACEPDVLIADEPTTALDVTVQAEILKLMKRLQKERGMSILFITHDLGVVSQMADRVGVMRAGKIVEEGELRKILYQPSHPYTQSLLQALPENLSKITFSSSSSNLLEPLLNVRNLKVYFPIRKGIFRRVVDQVKAVDAVDLTVARGEIVALVGESGCGKTTLGRAILRLIEPSSGGVFYNKKAITGLSRKAMQQYRSEMQIIFQDPMSSLNPRLTVATILTEPMKVHGIGASDEQRIELAAGMLRQVQLQEEHMWRYPHEFSGGQRQRIGIARALVLDPGFIVCDEVTSALDVSVQAEILQMLLELRQQRHLALLFITHNIGVVEYISDRTLVMYKGKIVEQGETEQVCGSPIHAYTRQLIKAVPRIQRPQLA
jgi:peptide/nickel transport system ATP-binding protein